MTNTKGHMISLVTRMLIVIAIAVSVSVVTAILLIQKLGVTWNSFLIIIFTVFVPATLGIVINYLYRRPRYRVL